MLRFQPMIFLWQPSLRACESEESAASKLDESSLIRPYQVLPVFPIRVLPLRGVGLSSLFCVPATGTDNQPGMNNAKK